MEIAWAAEKCGAKLLGINPEMMKWFAAAPDDDLPWTRLYASLCKRGYAAESLPDRICMSRKTVETINRLKRGEGIYHRSIWNSPIGDLQIDPCICGKFQNHSHAIRRSSGCGITNSLLSPMVRPHM